MPPTDFEDIEKRLDAFHTEVSEDELFDYMSEQIEDLDEAKKVHQAQFMASFMNYKTIKRMADQLDSMEGWLKYGASGIISISALTITVVLTTLV